MKLFQAFIGDEQRSFVSPSAIPFSAHDNTGNDQREYELLKRIWVEQSKADDPWGLISWKFQHKSLVSVDEFVDFAAASLTAGADCVFINPMIGNEALYYSVWEQGTDCGHAGLDKIIAFLNKNVGPRMAAPMGTESFAFCNYFVATPRFWNDYFKFVDGALSSLEAEVLNRSEVGKAYSGSASYARAPNTSMRPFVIERLFSSFVVQKSINCAAFPFTSEHYGLKFGGQLGRFLRALSRLKNSALQSQDKQKLQYWDRARQNILRNGIKVAVWHLDDPLAFFQSRECSEFMKLYGSVVL
jgi:hypothetical protein